MTGNDKDKAYVLKTARDQGVKFIRLWFTDILGILKNVAITIEELEEALEEGVGFDGSAIEGFTRDRESDMIAMPDPSTFAVLPWRPKENGVARMFCDIVKPGGEPFEGDPRWILKRNLKAAADLGYTFYVGPELEHFYFTSAEDPKPLDNGGYFDLTPLDIASDLRRETILALEELGIGVEFSHHEVAPSQHEIDFRYTDALTMADSVMTYRLVLKEIALKHGVYATFMPKPFADQNGSGMHINMSLFSGHGAAGKKREGERNAFFDPKDPRHLSETARKFLAGLLAHVREFTVVTNQWVNSYKRLIPGYEAPVYASWALTNRSDLIRVPGYNPGKEVSCRLELRSPDPACNPYLAFSAILAAGLEGLTAKKPLPLPPPAQTNVAALSDAERAEQGIASLPRDLGEAIEAARNSPLLRKALGDHAYHSFLENKRIEWERYRAAVTDFERKTYLPLL
ncbi:MAG: glutamine synthetase [Candidatus Omnitrophica bacterium CG11_big_fil_rev_8_21_14_0_20_64_10]|nr:MAG: glutamine synthetase [Candidatus Omnitrophica bacterium CG11_big_fil_rev_8_21_14_0_20_64_10]